MSVQSALMKQNLRRAQIADTVADYSTVTGTVELLGGGQGYMDVSFPITFTEKPTISFGYELEQGYQTPMVPVLHAVVNKWDLIETKSNSLRIKGCSLGFVVYSQVDDCVSFIHFTFAGVAFRNPIAPSLDVGESI